MIIIKQDSFKSVEKQNIVEKDQTSLKNIAN